MYTLLYDTVSVTVLGSSGQNSFGGETIDVLFRLNEWADVSPPPLSVSLTRYALFDEK
jgi:hypothetical protein